MHLPSEFAQIHTHTHILRAKQIPLRRVTGKSYSFCQYGFVLEMKNCTSKEQFCTLQRLMPRPFKLNDNVGNFFLKECVT